MGKEYGRHRNQEGSKEPANVVNQTSPARNSLPSSGHYSIEMDLDAITAGDLRVATLRMKCLARAVLGNEHDSDDAAQDAWCRVLNAPQTIKRSDAWLAGVARNVARERRRSQQRRKKREEHCALPEGKSADQIALDQMDALESLIQVVRSIDQPYRSALVLQFVVGLEPAQAAEALGVNRATHRSHVHRGLALVRAELHRKHQADRKPWQASIAPLLTGALPKLAGGIAVTKSTAALGGALLLLLIGSIAYVEISSRDAEHAIQDNYQESLSTEASHLEHLDASLDTDREASPPTMLGPPRNEPLTPSQANPALRSSGKSAPSAAKEDKEEHEEAETESQPKTVDEEEPKETKTRIWNVLHAVRVLKLEPHQAEDMQRIQNEVRDEILAILKTEPHTGRAPHEIKQDVADHLVATTREGRDKGTKFESELQAVMAQRMPGSSSTYKDVLAEIREEGHRRMRRVLTLQQLERWDEADTSTVFNVTMIAGGRHIKMRRAR